MATAGRTLPLFGQGRCHDHFPVYFRNGSLELRGHFLHRGCGGILRLTILINGEDGYYCLKCFKRSTLKADCYTCNMVSKCCAP